eukprot:scaffold102353_cov23-Tisochrysis_lutea.AAC.1
MAACRQNMGSRITMPKVPCAGRRQEWLHAGSAWGALLQRPRCPVHAGKKREWLHAGHTWAAASQCSRRP